METKFLFNDTEQFVKNLDKINYAKALRMIGLLEKYDNQVRYPYSKKVANKIFELRICGKLEIRIFYTFWGGIAILLHAFLKKSQAIPRKEMALASRRLKQLDTI